ncbi:Na+/H+ antiporter [Paenibacillus glycanilyticus]|uniref:Sodium, potassium, lithium and rubidium/H(+) antiporter n=1 Tax=Paenibacillus glycanilyticus TaxID=126569 RepID=A0ABQ6GA98_9BACL|nr:Na+/H+ antiporter [Paenibacillus glycanilyticus]GLX67891.1 sodium, potassium, lithium and rubidium/H(+) antiporter [Paenibacillus glycanilyticus]
MEIFIVVLVMLILIGVSNVIYRFIPFVPVPLIQIALGAVIAVIPFGVHLHLEPELFFILFIAPLLYNDGKHTPRDELWRLRAPILLLSIGLVFATVVVVGYTIHWMIPSIPLAAAFGLAAILSPTDPVAVNALASRVQLPKSLMRLLEGEALMNDASGLVAFKFAIAAAMTGVFSLQKATISFLIIALGGLLAGAVLAFIIIGIRQLLRRAGLEDETMHMLLQLVTPFILYLVAEEIGVSGILAAVAGGIVHAIEDDRVEHSIARLKTVSMNTWSVILFILNGLVFVILGIQIPEVTSVIFKNPGFNNAVVIWYAIVIFALLLLLRFVWTSLFTRIGSAKREAYSIKVIILTTVSGVRGAVTLAGAFSIPILLNNGNSFPQRDLIIFLAAFIILLSLLSASILLPIIAKKREIIDESEKAHEEREWQVKVMGAAVDHLEQVSNEKNEHAVESVIAEYKRLMMSLEMRDNPNRQMPKRREEELKMRIEALDIERNYVEERLKKGAINEKHAEFYFGMLDQIELILANRLHLWKMVLKGFWVKIKAGFTNNRKLAFSEADINVLRGLRLQCSEAVIDQMDARCVPGTKDDPAECVTAYYQQIVKRMRSMPVHTKNKTQHFHEARKELHWRAIQAEREEVQSLYEKGSIDREMASTLRRHIRDREASMYEEDEIG